MKHAKIIAPAESNLLPPIHLANVETARLLTIIARGEFGSFTGFWNCVSGQLFLSDDHAPEKTEGSGHLHMARVYQLLDETSLEHLKPNWYGFRIFSRGLIVLQSGTFGQIKKEYQALFKQQLESLFSRSR